MVMPEMFSAHWMMGSTFNNLQVKEVKTLHLLRVWDMHSPLRGKSVERRV